MRNFCHSCKFCTLTISVINADPSIDNRFWSTCQKRFDYVSKKSRKRVNRTTSLIIRLEYVLKMSWRCLEDIFAGRLENFLNTSWKHLRKASWRCLDVLKTFLQDVLKTSWRRLENVLKTSWRCMTRTNILVLIKTSWRRLEDVFWRRMSKANIFALIRTSWRRLEGVFWRRRQKTSSRRLHQDECLQGLKTVYYSLYFKFLYKFAIARLTLLSQGLGCYRIANAVVKIFLVYSVFWLFFQNVKTSYRC